MFVRPSTWRGGRSEESWGCSRTGKEGGIRWKKNGFGRDVHCDQNICRKRSFYLVGSPTRRWDWEKLFLFELHSAHLKMFIKRLKGEQLTQSLRQNWSLRTVRIHIEGNFETIFFVIRGPLLPGGVELSRWHCGWDRPYKQAFPLSLALLWFVFKKWYLWPIPIIIQRGFVFAEKTWSPLALVTMGLDPQMSVSYGRRF